MVSDGLEDLMKSYIAELKTIYGVHLCKVILYGAVE